MNKNKIVVYIDTHIHHLVFVLTNFFNAYTLEIIIFLSVFLSITSTSYYLTNNEILAYNDAKSHLNIARRVIDNKTPGIAQFGGTWLPLPQLLILPFVSNDYLWQTGLAGSIVSMISFIFASVIIFKICFKITKDNLAGFVASLLFMINRNVLYMQSTPMTELLLIATMTAGIYYLYLWLEKKQLSDLIISAFAIFLSTLSRYDGWFLFLICLMIIFIESSTFYKSKKKSEGNVIVFSSLASLGIILWFSWNAVIWGRPLYFLSGEHSARHQQAQIEASGQLLTKHNFYLSAKTVLEMTYMNSGIFSALLFLLSIVIIMKVNYKNRIIFFIILLLLSPILFNFVSLIFGISIVDTTLAKMFNIRYGIMGMPLVVIVIGIFTSYFHRIKKFIYIAIIILLAVLPYRVVTLYDPLYSSSGTKPEVTEMEKYFKTIYKDGNILISVFAYDPSMHVFGIHFNKYIHEGNYKLWEKALANPEKYVNWVLMTQNTDNDVLYRYYSKNKIRFNKYYKVVYVKNNYLILKKN